MVTKWKYILFSDQTRWRLYISSPDVYHAVTEENICYDHGWNLSVMIETYAAATFDMICALEVNTKTKLKTLNAWQWLSYFKVW